MKTFSNLVCRVAAPAALTVLPLPFHTADVQAHRIGQPLSLAY